MEQSQPRLHVPRSRRDNPTYLDLPKPVRYTYDIRTPFPADTPAAAAEYPHAALHIRFLSICFRPSDRFTPCGFSAEGRSIEGYRIEKGGGRGK
ncbi:hypothetical protein ZHAS_00019293 [Anopheles sinensis]|uniref:Uncharacterized protein n=1 Tax=Anopheles sinensis TaxID=74873 RepID=A0A084WM06_ANOSI|nr:hypothetical protein ZHAS_00019293 [Anopheles sinensis]